jgi:SAM-dependent methyltransferase
MAELKVCDGVDDVREQVRLRYAAAATAASGCGGAGTGLASCCAPDLTLDKHGAEVFGAALYGGENEPALAASLGCGVPTAVADLHEGETVLDLGSGAGGDVLIAARRVGPAGRAIGLDMTDEMLALARKNRETLGIANAEFFKGEIEDMPLESDSFDRIISNCVINLVPDKRKAFAEMYRVLKPGGKFTLSDIVSIGVIPDSLRDDLGLWCGCVAGASDRDEYLAIVKEAGFTEITIAKEKPYDLEETVAFGLESITFTAQKPGR